MKCCCYAFRVIFSLFVWIFKKVTGVNIKHLFIASSDRSVYFKCKGCSVQVEDVLLNCESWNSVLLSNNIPVRLNYGSVEHFQLSIGWLLFGKISIRIKGLNILLSTTNERQYNLEQELRKHITNKRFLINTLEKLHGRQEMPSSGNYGRIARFVICLLVFFLRKVQVELENVHLRVEEKKVISKEVTSLGVAMKSLTITEDKSLRKALATSNWCSAKQLKTSLLSVYWNPHEHSAAMLTDLPNEIKKEKLKMATYQKSLGHSYVVYPCSPSLTLSLEPAMDALVKARVTCNMDSVKVSVSKNQLRVAVVVSGHVKHLQNMTEFLRYRPNSRIVQGETKKWWLYAFKCIRLLQTSSKWDWLEVKEEGILKEKYSNAYSKLLLKKGSTKKLKKQLQVLEDELSVLGTIVTRRKVEKELSLLNQSANTKRHSSMFRGGGGSLYSLSGQCCVGRLEVSLSSDYRESLVTECEETDILTIKVFKSHLGISTEGQQTSFVAKVEDIQCLGVNGEADTRSNILLCNATRNNADVISLNISWLNNTVDTSDDLARYTYHISAHATPTTLHFDWSTFSKLVEFAAVIRGTHKDLQEAVKARVKEVGRESKLKFQHFIANKERASVDANITLPTITFDTPNTKYNHLKCHFGTLNVLTTDDTTHAASSNGTVSVKYKVHLKDARICLLSSENETTDTLTESYCNTVTMFQLAKVVSDVQYTTYEDSLVPSNLSANINCPELYVGMKNGVLEAFVQFLYDQLKYSVKTMNSINSESSSLKQSDTILSSAQNYSSTLPVDISQGELLERIAMEEEADFRFNADSKIFECVASINLIKILLSEPENGPHLMMTVQNVFALFLLKEQATEMKVQVSSLQLLDHTQKDESNDPIPLLHTDPDFLTFFACFADPHAQLFSSQYKSTEDLYIIELTPLTISLHYECMNNILVWIAQMKLPPFKSLLGSLYKKKEEIEENTTEDNAAVQPPTRDAVKCLCTFKLQQVIITLDSCHSSSLLTARIQDILARYCDRYNNGTIGVSVQHFTLADGLIVFDSPYHLVIANTRSEQLLNINMSYKLVGLQVFTKFEVDIGSVKVVYLHKLTKTLQIIVTTLLKNYSIMKKQCCLKLIADTRDKSRESVKPVPATKDEKTNTSRYSYHGCVNIHKCSIKLPKDTHHPDALTLNARQLKLLLEQEEETTTQIEEIEEPDTDPLQPFLNSTQEQVSYLKATAEAIELNWNYGSIERTVATTKSFIIDKECSSWIVDFDSIEVFLTGETLASVPSLLSSNFSEQDLYTIAIITDDITDTSNSSCSSQEKNRPKIVQMQDVDDFATDEYFNPFLKVKARTLNLMIQISEGIKTSAIATIDLNNSCVAVGTLSRLNDRDRSEEGMAVEMCVGDIEGVEGEGSDNRHKILTTYVHELSFRAAPSVIKIRVHNLSSTGTEVFVGVNSVCLCVWPVFLHLLMKFKKQIKLREGRRGKWWKTRRRSTIASLEQKLSIISQQEHSRFNSDDNSSTTRGFGITVELETVGIALLENPSSFEETTPGAIIEFQSIDQDEKRECGVVMKYSYMSPKSWSLNLSPCCFHGSLCLFENNILPQIKVNGKFIPPTSLSLDFNVTEGQQKLSIHVPTLELHVTNELYQVIFNFYNTYTTDSQCTQCCEDISSVISDDIWSIKNFNRTSVLPDLPDESFDDIDGADYSSDDEDDPVFEFRDLQQDQQEAYIDFNNVTINFDLMSSCDSDSVPVICLHSSVHCVVNQWSTKLTANVDVNLESFIYNERRGAWEPLIEPLNTGDGYYTPYSFNIKVFRLLAGEEAEYFLSNLPKSRSMISIGSDKADFDSPKISRGAFSSKSSMASDQLSLVSSSPLPSPSLKKKPGQSTFRSTQSFQQGQSPDLGSNVKRTLASDSISTKSTEENNDSSTYLILLTSNDRLELTLTPSALKTVLMYSQVLGVDYQKAMANIRNCIDDTRPPIRIENKTGGAIIVYPGPTFKDGDRSYKTPFKCHVRTLKHFPSRICNMTDFVSPTKSLPSISEEQGHSSPSPSLHSKRSHHSSGSPLYPTPSDNSFPFFVKSMDTCPIETDADTICKDTNDDGTMELESSLTTLKDNIISVIEGDMFDVIDQDDNNSIDGTYSLESCNTPFSRLEHTKKRRKSVCHLHLLHSTSTGTTGTSKRGKSNEKDSTDYWRPKLLRKMHKIKLQLYDSTKSLTVPVALPGIFAVPIKHDQFGHIALVCEVSFNRGVRKVAVKSGLQIKNSLPIKVVVYSFDRKSKGIEKLDEIGKEGQILDVPVGAVVDKNMVLKFGVGPDGKPCQQIIHWKILSALETQSQIIVCPQSLDSGKNYYFQASIKLIPAVHQTIHSPSHIITLESAMAIHNHLPFTIDMVLGYTDPTIPSQLIQIEECIRKSIFDLPPRGDYTMRFSFEYVGMSWSGECVKVGNCFEKMVKCYGYRKNRKTAMKMYINFRAMHDSPHIINVFAPYWIVNKTSMDLEFEHQPGKHRIHNVCSSDDSKPLLITYKSGIRQHKVKLRVIGGEWTKSFVLGAVGKIINITSIRTSFHYEFAIETHLLDSTLSEIVYIMPKYSIVNYTPISLSCTSLGSNGTPHKDTNVLLEPKDTTLEPFWPGKYNLVELAVIDHENTAHTKRFKFSLSILSPTLIKIGHEVLPVVTVRVQPDPIRGTTVIAIRPIVNVGAMLKIQNLCRCNCIKFMQKLTSGPGQLYPLDPNQSILYTWDCPVASRELNWQVDRAQDASWKTMTFDKPKQSGLARVLVRRLNSNDPKLVTIFWTSTFEGSKLVLRFLDDKEDYNRLSQTRVSPDKIQFFCSLEGLGISLVNNTPKEIAYFTIISSPVLWTKKRPTAGAVWSAISREHSEQLEAALKMDQPSVDINGEKYDLENMIIGSHKGGEICRKFNPGIWIWYSKRNNHQSLNLKLGKVQIDNQLESIELSTRVVFSELESRYSGDLAEVSVPFLDFEVSVSMHGKDAIREYEKVLIKIKPSQVNIELGFIAALLPFADASFAKSVKDKNYAMNQLDKTLYNLLDAKNLVAIRTVNYVDALQINQTSVSVTYTTAGEYNLSSEWGKVINAIIHFALISSGYFNISLKSVNISNEITDLSQIKRTLYGHYKNEVLWQFQHFALGLDVIGNPAKLFNSFQTGAKDLVFKSREGIVEGEAGYGIALGVKSLLGHVVGGGANSIVLSAGSLSSLLLAATELDYQREHRHMRQTKDSTGIVLAGRFFLKGIFRGTTDIFVKPATGAVNEGIEGFLKGLGRGTVSILVKPTLGIVDLAKYTMESVRSAVDDEMEVQTVRRPRLLHIDEEMKPFDYYEAEGLYILKHLSEPLSKEYYIAHCWQPELPDQKNNMVIMVTTKQLLQLYKTNKKYCVNWSMGLENIESVQVADYQDDDDTGEYRPGLILKGRFNKSRRDMQHFVFRMEQQTDVTTIKVKLQRAMIRNIASNRS